jgi:hypothetical protein
LKMDYFLKQFPGREALLQGSRHGISARTVKVNNHIHTPYSFSAFSSVAEAVERAMKEDIRVLGINDFYVTDGYPEFVRQCLEKGIFPLLNVEMIGVNAGGQAMGTRYNDPGNPGRIYVSGKGLSFGSLLSPERQDRVDRVVEESNRQVKEMIRLLNFWLQRQGAGISLSVEETRERLAENLLRERHVAKMLRIKIGERCSDDREYLELITAIYGGKPPGAVHSDVAGIENELRSRLLKAGAPAYVPEDERAFLPLEEITSLLTESGGIPTYPMLLDGAGGKMTEFEANSENLMAELQEKGFRSVEMIPLRNRHDVLKDYAGYFYRKGFMVSFGTEHNTSSGGPLTVRCLGGEPLDEELTEIGFNGAACIAAHQYLTALEGPGYVKLTREELEELGKAVFAYYFNTFIPDLHS